MFFFGERKSLNERRLWRPDLTKENFSFGPLVVGTKTFSLGQPVNKEEASGKKSLTRQVHFHRFLRPKRKRIVSSFAQRCNVVKHEIVRFYLSIFMESDRHGHHSIALEMLFHLSFD